MVTAECTIVVLVQENERSKDVIIDHRFHKQIIGTKGEKIREIRDRFNGVQVSELCYSFLVTILLKGLHFTLNWYIFDQ